MQGQAHIHKTKATKKLSSLKSVLNTYTVIGLTLWIIATILVLVPSFPYIWYTLDKDASKEEFQSIVGPTQAGDDSSFNEVIDPKTSDPTQTEPQIPELPPRDLSLPQKNYLRIPKIGVNGQIHESTIPENALQKGVWRVPEFGTPEDNTAIILASHRFGYLSWSRDFRNKNSFYYLPKTKVGDTITIIWNQREYVYQIYNAEEDTEIKDYDADLILYTCKLIDSPVRVFRYARRVN